MTTLILTFFLLSLVIAAMAIGVLLGRKPITGSCGGIGAALGEKDYTCDICGGDPRKCEEQQVQVPTQQVQAQETAQINAGQKDLFVDASQQIRR